MLVQRAPWPGAAVAAIFVALLGCDDGGPTRSPSPTDGGGGIDSATVDANLEPEDASLESDGGVDGGESPGCTFMEGDVRQLQALGVRMDDAPALAVRNDGFLVAWVRATQSPPAFQPLVVQRRSVDLSSASAVTVVEHLSLQRDPAIVTTASGYLVAWRDDVDGAFDIKVRAVDAAGVPLGEGEVSVTSSGVDDGPPAMARRGDHVLVAWVTGGEGFTRLLAADGTPLAGAQPIAGLGGAVARPAVASVDSGYALAWVTGGEVHVQALDTDGVAVGAPARADGEANATGRLHLATSGGSGAVAFDVRVGGERAEVRLRPIDESAAPVMQEAPVTPVPHRGQASSIAPLLGGHAVAYRGTTDGVVGESLRLVLVDERGNGIDGFIPLRDTQPPPTASVVRTSPDARHVLVAWTDDGGALVAYVGCQ
jgi:hypothetical protein